MPGGYLIDAMFDAGPTIEIAEGELPLNWTEVWSWASAMQADEAPWEPWELREVRGLSRHYLRAKLDGADPLAISPVEQAAAENDEV